MIPNFSSWPTLSVSLRVGFANLECYVNNNYIGHSQIRQWYLQYIPVDEALHKIKSDGAFIYKDLIVCWCYSIYMYSHVDFENTTLKLHLHYATSLMSIALQLHCIKSQNFKDDSEIKILNLSVRNINFLEDLKSLKPNQTKTFSPECSFDIIFNHHFSMKILKMKSAEWSWSKPLAPKDLGTIYM